MFTCRLLSAERFFVSLLLRDRVQTTEFLLFRKNAEMLLEHSGVKRADHIYRRPFIYFEVFFMPALISVSSEELKRRLSFNSDIFFNLHFCQRELVFDSSRTLRGKYRTKTVSVHLLRPVGMFVYSLICSAVGSSQQRLREDDEETP